MTDAEPTENLFALARQLAHAETVDAVVDAVSRFGPAIVGADEFAVGLFAADGVHIHHGVGSLFHGRDLVAVAEVADLAAGGVCRHDGITGVSLEYGDGERGLLAIRWDGPAPVDEGTVARLGSLVEHSLDRSDRQQRETAVAATLQAALLPTELRAVPGLEVAVRHRPVADRVGGDFYDLLAVDDGALVFVGDVTGHGLAAAQVMATVRAYLRALGLEHGDPARLLAVANQLMIEDRRTGLATVVVAHWRRSTGELVIANAGHPAPVTARPGEVAAPVTVERGPMLGAVDDAIYTTTTEPLSSGATVVLYTDGLVEDRGEGPSAGLDELVAVVDADDGTDVEALADQLIGLTGGDVVDDAAVVVLRVS